MLGRGNLMLLALSIAACRDSGPIGKGSPSWVAIGSNEPALDARVDVGTLHGADRGAIEVWIEFPSSPGVLATLRSMHPELNLPDGTYTRDRVRIACGVDGYRSTSLETLYLGPDGVEVGTSGALSPDTRPMRYGRGAESLACLAAASKCDGVPLSWPPPQNEADPGDADAQQAYALRFVPGCPL